MLNLKVPELLRQAALVGGAWRAGESTIPVINPANGAVIAETPDLGADAACEAIDAASGAFAAWSRRPAKERATILRRWSELMLAHADDLATILTAEQGKPRAEAKGEVAYAAAFLEWFAEEARRVQGEILTPHREDMRLTVSREPVGVVAAITPWNFPLAMITRKAGPALAVGCTMVLKPSELTPLSALALGWLGQQAGLPDGAFNVVTGQAAPIGDVLTSDPRVRKLTFTGSTRVGKLLAARCMDTVKRISLELGGNAPFLVFDDADIEAAVDGAIASKFRNTGQTCVCANRFLVQAGVYEVFAQRLTDKVAGMVVGAGLEGPTDQGPLINSAAVAKVVQHVANAVAGGGRILTGGMVLDRPGHFHSPTVIVDVSPEAQLCHEETFGPVAGLVRFETEAQAIALANDTTAGLAAYMFTRDLDRATRVSEALKYGMIGLNTGLISTEIAPFGGVKESGLGREGSHLGVEDYLDIKLVCRAIAAAS